MRVFTVLGPAHSGKTTLVEALAELDGRKQRFELSDAAVLYGFSYLGEPWTAIDIAGGSDTLALAGPALAASDAAVLCVPPEADAAVLVAPYLRLIEDAQIPCFLFINRMDAADERVRDIVAALQAYCGHTIVLRQVPMREGGTIIGAVDLISERAWKYNEGEPSDLIELPAEIAPREEEARTELLESLADFDDDLLTQLIEDKRPATEDVFSLAARVSQHHDLVSAFVGAASHNNGVTRLMKSLRHEAPDHTWLAGRLGDAASASAIGILADMRKHIGKLTVIRALGADLAQGDTLGGEGLGNLVAFDGKTPVKSLAAGDIGLAIKSDHLTAGQAYTAGGTTAMPAWAAARPPALHATVAPANERDDVRLSTALHKLAEIDPGLVFTQDERSGKAILSFQGQTHQRRVTDKLAQDFGIEIETSTVPPAYRETISKAKETHHRHRKQSGGAGQFADVLIDIKPQPRGTGFAFDEIVKGGAVPRNYIPAVQAGVEDALAEGPHGYPVVDLAVTLKDGKHHAVDSSDFAFRTAGRNAVRESLQDLGTKVLQPVMRVDIEVPSVFAGGLVPTISGLKGQVLGFEANAGAAGWDVFSALLPASALDELQRALGAATRGTAWAVVAFDHYEEMHGSDAALLHAGA